MKKKLRMCSSRGTVERNQLDTSEGWKERDTFKMMEYRPSERRSSVG